MGPNRFRRGYEEDKLQAEDSFAGLVNHAWQTLTGEELALAA